MLDDFKNGVSEYQGVNVYSVYKEQFKNNWFSINSPLALI